MHKNQKPTYYTSVNSKQFAMSKDKTRSQISSKLADK